MNNPVLLTPEQLDEIRAFGLYDCEQAPDLAYGTLCHLLAHAAALTARAEKAEASLIKAKDIVEILLPSNTALAAHAEKAEARVKEQTAELAEQEVAKLALVKEIKARDKCEDAVIWQLTRSITDTFQDYGTKWGGPAVGHSKRFWSDVEDVWYDDIKNTLWPTRAEETEARVKEQGGRVNCPSCDNSLAWDEAWAGSNQCKHCGYAGKSEARPSLTTCTRPVPPLSTTPNTKPLNS